MTWLILAGRGFGKTRAGAEWVAKQMRDQPGCRVALVAATFSDGRDTMVEGESGLLSVLDDAELRGGTRDGGFNRSLGELFHENGSRAKVYSSERPRQLRGPQHHFAWCDEAASWEDASKGTEYDTTWSNLLLGLRLGENPQAVVTTTPKPCRLIVGTREKPGLLAKATITRGNTYENLGNLAPTFRDAILDQYEGTRLGRQELMAEVLTEVPGALWTYDLIEEGRLREAPPLRRVVVGVDPAATKTGDRTGIIIAGVGQCRCKGSPEEHGFVLDDYSLKATPKEWGERVVQGMADYEGDRVVAEVNNGGEMVEHVLRTIDAKIPYKAVHAQKSKQARAEPISALYEQGRVHHIGTHQDLEDELCSWEPDSGAPSPDRLDALVWALSELMLGNKDYSSRSAPVGIDHTSYWR